MKYEVSSWHYTTLLVLDMSDTGPAFDQFNIFIRENNFKVK